MLKHDECEAETSEKKRTMKMNETRRTDQEGKEKSPYRQICLPHLDNDNAKHKHDY